MDANALAKGAIERGAIQKVDELSPFLNLLGKTKKLNTVVEIGTARGGLFWALCQVADPRATIVSLDLYQGAFGGGYDLKQQKVIATYGQPKQKLHFIRKDSHLETTKAALQKILRRPIDALIVDGDHTYAGVRKDFEMYSPLVKKGGLIAFHDIFEHPFAPSCQVDLFWKEVKMKHFAQEIKDYKESHWGGIGVLTYKKKPQIVYEDKKGLLLDLNPFLARKPDFTGVGPRAHPNVDIVVDFLKIPWPFEDSSCQIIAAAQVFQKIPRNMVIPWMNEMWRILKPRGQLALALPYAGSPGYYADPLNVNPCNEMTFYYFDPFFPAYAHYEPKPWEIEKGSPQWAVGGNLEIVMRPRK